MLALSISELLTLGPEASWSEWQDNGSHLPSWADGSGASHVEPLNCSPWDLPGLHKLNDFAIWQRQSDEPIWPGMPLPVDSRPKADLEVVALTKISWQAPQKLSVEGVGSMVPLSSWASPLRVPLPEPFLAEDSAMLDLPQASPSPELTTLARAASWPQGGVDACEGVDFRSWTTLVEPPPGLEGLVAAAALPQKPAAPAPGAVKPALPLPVGMSMCSVDVGGTARTRIEWRIDDLVGKLQASMGRPLVSPPFSALGLPNLRLMVFPDGRDTLKNARSGERKGLYTTMIKKGPLFGALKLKADCLDCAAVMSVNLSVGGVRAGPLMYNFSEQAIHGVDDFGVDWLKQTDQGGSLTVGMEILEVHTQISSC
ncbi:unnamed protein product [Polarella glacialis]|uniref:Uncharacterized protein n=1 Tax=Polarella glacialis TaxID=89957 RepID=A0A813IXD7_POLGL|nr:unnamed protein product [Polarella glacialis]